jgi:hypothetical protein
MMCPRLLDRVGGAGGTFVGISQLGMMNPRLFDHVGGAGGGISQLVAFLSLRGGSGGAHLAVPGLRGGSGGGVAHWAM